MDNWVSEVIKILAGAIAGVLLTETFPTIKTFFKKGSQSLRNLSIKGFIDEYKVIKAYKENHATLAVEILRRLATSILYIFLFTALVSVEIFIRLNGRSDAITDNPAILGVFIGIIGARFTEISRLIDKVRDFEKYKEETIKKLIKLGGNPEDLDKEEG